MSGTDLISRQAAIDEIDEWIKAFLENGHKESAADACLIQDGIIQLPSAQPEIIYCKDCVHHIDGFFCRQANHHTSDKDHCASVFGAERREE